MKVRQFARGLWEHEPSLTLGCKHFRPLAPKFQVQPEPDNVSLDLKTFIRPDSGPRKLGSADAKRDSSQVETHPGGTRWNPTQEQIGILEMLYRGGMRTPNAQQIEQITSQLGKYGKIEGKNVFYWFQNHKARERQKQKRNILCPNQSLRTPSPVTSTVHLTQDLRGYKGNEEDSIFKRKCRSWTYECSEEDKRYRREEGDRTLLLFPLHPENR